VIGRHMAGGILAAAASEFVESKLKTGRQAVQKSTQANGLCASNPLDVEPSCPEKGSDRN
jgi:hypothetical protein